MEKTSKLRRPMTLTQMEEQPRESVTILQPHPNPEPEPDSERTPPAPPDPPPQTERLPFEPHSLCQITNKESRWFGVVFTAGAVSDTEIHGYYIQPGGRHFITAPLADCEIVGKAIVKSKTPCSPEWIKTHGQPS